MNEIGKHRVKKLRKWPICEENFASFSLELGAKKLRLKFLVDNSGKNFFQYVALHGTDWIDFLFFLAVFLALTVIFPCFLCSVVFNEVVDSVKRIQWVSFPNLCFSH